MTLLLVAVAALCGCRTSPHVASFIENRNAEARQQEDEYWQQVQENERLAYELEKLKRQKEKDARSTDDLGPPKVEEGVGPPTIEIPGTSPGRPEEMKQEPERPQIEPEPPPRPDGAAEDDPAGARPGELPPPRGAAPAKPAEPEVIDQKVTHLFLNPLHTGGIDLDQRPGDDGLSLLLEPRNAANQFVPLAGNVSVVLLDPQQSGDAARVARWNFGSQETRLAIRQDGETRGIRLEMPWPSRPPENGPLRLFVRYEMADGRKIQAEREVFVKLPGQFSERWTPRPPERQRRNAPVDSAVAEQSPSPGALPAAPVPPAVAQRAIKEPAPMAVAPSTETPTATGHSSPPLLTPPPALSEAPGNAAPSRPQWKPYR